MLPLLYVVFVLSGAAGLIYESIWTRYLGLFVGHSAYAQVIVLVIFLGGMSLGALLIGRRTEFTPKFLFSDRERPNLVLRVRIRVHDPERRLRAGLPAFVTIEDDNAAAGGNAMVDLIRWARTNWP